MPPAASVMGKVPHILCRATARAGEARVASLKLPHVRISSRSGAVAKYRDQRQLLGARVCLGSQFQRDKRLSCWEAWQQASGLVVGAGSREVTLSSAGEQEVGRDCEHPKPALRDELLPVRLHLTLSPPQSRDSTVSPDSITYWEHSDQVPTHVTHSQLNPHMP